MEQGERLAAYLAGELAPDEAAALEAELARDPRLRERLERIRRVDELLGSVEDPEPSAEFSERLRAAIAGELTSGGGRAASRQAGEGEPASTEPTGAAAAPGTAGRGRGRTPATQRPVIDELARRRLARRRSLTPLAGAAAAAAAIALIGVVTGYGLRGADRETGVVATTERPIPEVVVRSTDNDYDDQELRRLAVNVDTTGHLLPGSSAEEAAPVADALVGRILREEPLAVGDQAASDGGAADAPTEAQGGDRGSGAGEEGGGSAVPQVDGAEALERCLAGIVGGSERPLVPVYIEHATFDGQPAIIFGFVDEEPRSGEYRRVRIHAVAPDTCEELASATYDRAG